MLGFKFITKSEIFAARQAAEGKPDGGKIREIKIIKPSKPSHLT